MPATLPDYVVEDQGNRPNLDALAAQSSIVAPPAPSTAFVPPKPPAALGNVQQAISALTPEYERSRKAVTEAERDTLTKKRETLTPAIEKVKASAGANTPPAPVEQPEPPVPDTSPRAFLSGEGKNALQQMVAGLGLLITAAAGARRAPAQALGALTGAMTGWAEGDAERASRDWHHYEGLVAKMNRENQKAVKAWERAMVIRGGNQQDAKLFLEGSLAESGLSDLAAEYAGKDYQRIGQELTTAQSLLVKMDTEYNNTVRTALDQWYKAKEVEHRTKQEAHWERQDKKLAGRPQVRIVEVMGEDGQAVKKAVILNPDGTVNEEDVGQSPRFSEARINFERREKTVKDFTGGGMPAKEVRAINTAQNHLETLDQLAAALNNSDVRGFNAVAQAWAKQTGHPAPVSWDAAIGVVGGELAKAIVGTGQTALADRQEVASNIAKQTTPQQWADPTLGVSHTYKELMAGKLVELGRAYEGGSGLQDFETRFLSPASRKLYHSLGAASSSRTGGYIETRITKDGKKLGKKADGTIEEIH